MPRSTLNFNIRKSRNGINAMITYIQGQIQSISEHPPRAVVLTEGGVGYLISLPVFVHDSLQKQHKKPGDNAQFHIYYSVTERQPLPVLVGFEHLTDRTFFEQFVQVEGIGPTKAAAALIMPVPTIARAIETSDATTLQTMPGIGARAAQKIVATLKGKVSEAAAATYQIDEHGTPTQTSARLEVIGVLTTLGYRNNDAITYVDQALAREPELAEDEQKLLQEVFRQHPTATAAPAR